MTLNCGLFVIFCHLLRIIVDELSNCASKLAKWFLITLSPRLSSTNIIIIDAFIFVTVPTVLSTLAEMKPTGNILGVGYHCRFGLRSHTGGMGGGMGKGYSR